MIKKRRLFFDIETSFNIGIFWRAGYNQTIRPEDIIHERAIICVCWKWEGEDKIHSLTWDRNQSDKQLLEKFIKVLNEANEIIAHNGDRFDVKWLKTRCLFHRIPMFPRYQSVDTLKIGKAQFNFNSNKLDYIAKFLGVGEKMEHEGLDLWKKIILHKDKESLTKMVDYCKQDVVILEKVYNELKNYAPHTFNYAAYNYDEKWACPECASLHTTLNKTHTTRQGVIKRYMRCSDKACSKAYPISNKAYMDYLTWKARNNIM
jgi:hypothetical protein